MPLRPALAVFALLCLLVPSVRAAEPPAAGATTRPDVIGIGDLLAIDLFNLTDKGGSIKEARVDARGRASLPLLGRVPVAGRTLAEAEKAIAQAYRENNVAPHVGVAIDRVERGRPEHAARGPLAPGDVVRLAVWDLASGGQTVRDLHVGETGNVGLPILGQTKVGGLSEEQAEQVIIKAYRDAAIIENPSVELERIDPKSAVRPAAE